MAHQASLLFALALLCGMAVGDVFLATFDGASKTTFNWQVVNDPVMGGRSVSKAYVNKTSSTAVWDGEVVIVPSLNAPGFCNYETTNKFVRFNDASPYSHLLLHVRTANPEYLGYKVSFAADTIDRQFKSFKANFNITGTDWTTVAIPFTQFSNDWSAYTGNCDTKDPTGLQHHCCSAEHPEVCPTTKNLRDISELGVWTEGASGKFHLEILWIGAGNATANTATSSDAFALPSAAVVAAAAEKNREKNGDIPHRSTCKSPIQAHLKYNVSGRLAQDYLPFGGFLPLEGLAFAVCCDIEFEAFAEPASFFAQPDVDLFAHLDEGATTVFYDSACGLPVFMAPVNRTLADFKADTTNHTWPSFRPGEIILENVIINATSGDISSTCGTHLGSYDPDARGPRYCIDLSCISGNKAL